MSSGFLPRGTADGWFRIGRLDVTTTVAYLLITGVATVFGAFTGLIQHTLFSLLAVMGGEVWRLVTWPFVEVLSLWSFFSFFILWYFGTMIEAELGKARMVRFYVSLWSVATASSALTGVLLPGSTILAGVGTFELIVLLLFIGEAPRRPFFFGIPAWVIGAVIVGIRVIQLSAAGMWGALAALMLTLVGAAYVARSFGLLTGWTWLPFSGPRRRKPKLRRVPSAAPASSRRKRRLSDEERLDELLAQISAGGMDSLSKREREELLKLSERRRRN